MLRIIRLDRAGKLQVIDEVVVEPAGVALDQGAGLAREAVEDQIAGVAEVEADRAGADEAIKNVADGFRICWLLLLHREERKAVQTQGGIGSEDGGVGPEHIGDAGPLEDPAVLEEKDLLADRDPPGGALQVGQEPIEGCQQGRQDRARDFATLGFHTAHVRDFRLKPSHASSARAINC
ncbi:hypothetical protein IQ216_03175 [Cyanobium sp. LEGE 06143]|nr:hypothetical protein [Cyanobium sp. LEGE 06143]